MLPSVPKQELGDTRFPNAMVGLEFTRIVNTAVEAHCPEVGVNV